MDLYLTDEDFKTAEANGISYENAYARFYNYGWVKKDAITKPVLRRDLWINHKEECEKNGINRSTFLSRVRKGLPPEKAASLPVASFGQKLEPEKHPTKISKEMKELATKNGISYNTFSIRVYKYKWDVLKAATTPIKTQFRRRDFVETNRT